jgi:lambda family phage portal protein
MKMDVKRPGILRRLWMRLRGVKPWRKRGYHAADTSRRHGGWTRSASSANAEIDRALELTRQSARELVRNDATAASAVSVIVTNMVGEGIQPESALPTRLGELELPATSVDEAQTMDERCDQIWLEALEELEASGQLDAYGQQILAARGMVESGEVLMQRHWRRAEDGLAVPVQTELLEGDLLDRYKTETTADGGKVVQGVEFDAQGRRQGYWLYPEHPGSLLPGRFDSSGSSIWTTSSRVPATELSHVYEPLRPGQVRGISFLSPVTQAMQQLADLKDFEGERRRMEASIFASVHGLGSDYALQSETGSGAAVVTDSNGEVIEEWQPGTIVYAPDGTELKLHAPASVGGVAEYQRQQLTSIASGMRMVYTLLTGDLSGTNYSSIRAGLIEFRRFIRSLRQQVFIRTVCAVQWRWVMEAAQTIGRLPLSDPNGRPIRWKARWSPPAFESVNRLMDAQADNWELANATTDLFTMIRSKGMVPEEVLKSQATALTMLNDLEIPAAWRVFRPWNLDPSQETSGDEADSAQTVP